MEHREVEVEDLLEVEGLVAVDLAVEEGLGEEEEGVVVDIERRYFFSSLLRVFLPPCCKQSDFLILFQYSIAGISSVAA
jgi:hypothetical protein